MRRWICKVSICSALDLYLRFQDFRPFLSGILFWNFEKMLTRLHLSSVLRRTTNFRSEKSLACFWIVKLIRECLWVCEQQLRSLSASTKTLTQSFKHLTFVGYSSTDQSWLERALRLNTLFVYRRFADLSFLRIFIQIFKFGFQSRPQAFPTFSYVYRVSSAFNYFGFEIKLR